jgi:hypothetical protein
MSSTGPHTNATAFLDASIIRDSPFLSSNRVAPSIDTQAEHLPSSGFVSLIVQFSGRIKGLNEREWGAIGVKRMAGTLLYTMDPPAAKL